MWVTESVSLAIVIFWKRKKRCGRVGIYRTGPQHAPVDGTAREAADCHFGATYLSRDSLTRTVF